MTSFLECGLFRVFKHVARHGLKHRHPHRIGRHVRRAVRVAASKPAAVLWVCVATSWPQNAIPGRDLATNGPQSAIAGSAGAVEYFPPEFETAALLPPLFLIPSAMPAAAFAPVPDCCTPGPLFPQPSSPPEQPTQPEPEPGSLALLATGVAALAIIRGRKA